MKHIRSIHLVLLTGLITINMMAQTEKNDLLRFNPANFNEGVLELPAGQKVKYRSYEKIYYVANIVDSVYQTLNIYIPEEVYTSNTKPLIFLKTNIGGYMASKASGPSATDATGRALLEGYVVVIPGSRGSNSTVTNTNGKTTWTGRAPAGIVDLKAAVRYLRYNKNQIPGNTDMIISDGTSAGGAMSALLGSTGNHPAYEPFLKELGAAREQDNIFAAVCYCPITDLDHADMAYEWLYQSVNNQTREITDEQKKVSDELAALYPAYLNSLRLAKPDGTLLTENNYLEYIKSFLIRSAQRARNEGFDIPAETGVKLNSGFRDSPGEIVTDINLNTYLIYINNIRKLKTPPAFDAMEVAGAKDSPENKVFGNAEGRSVNFTDYSLRKSTGNANAVIDKNIQEIVDIMNPINFIGDGVSTTCQNWYIRHGALDRDTSFPVPVNLYTKLINNGYSADFFLPWNRNHSGDYNLDELFTWIKAISE